MERSPVRDLELKVLLNSALSDQLDNFTLLARGLDASYAYEGYMAYRAEDLVRDEAVAKGDDDD
mgnify:FL=1